MKIRKNYRFHEETLLKVSELLKESEKFYGIKLSETMLLELLVTKEFQNKLKQP